MVAPDDATVFPSMPNDLSSFWMPFTANRQFKQSPRMLVGAKDMHYTAADGRQILDGTAGLWCVNAGHGRQRIVEAVQKQVAQLDYAPAFQMGHPIVFDLANKVADIAPEGLNRVFFVNSGSEAVDTALKIALNYQRARGQGTRTRLIGRERGYHGVGFGGISVGGIVKNRMHFGTLLTGVDHIRDTHLPADNAFSRGQPPHGADLADDLERLVKLHDASTIAAVIVEPVAGSTGVLVPPQGYLQRLRDICDRHGILLIFDEVITGFGRVGAAFGSQRFGVTPDIITTAKGISNGTVPMGAVLCRQEIHDTIVNGAPDDTIELFHGYTYSGHPLACAAALATLEIYREEDLFARALALEPYFEDALHSLKDAANVIDVRNVGLVGGIELEPIEGKPTKRAFEAFLKAYDKGLMIRTTGDIIALSPPLIIEKSHIDEIVGTIADILPTLH